MQERPTRLFHRLAVIVPGISGSTVAIIFKLYDQFLYAVGNLFKQFKKCFMFLLPIGIGMVVGVLLGFFTVEKLLGLLPFAVVGLFAGLMSGAFPAVKDELKGRGDEREAHRAFNRRRTHPESPSASFPSLSTLPTRPKRRRTSLRPSNGGRCSCVFPSGISSASRRSSPD